MPKKRYKNHYNWKRDPMNKWYPSKCGKTVLHDRELEKMENKLAFERVFDNITAVCSMTASTVEDLTRRFFNESIKSVEKLSYGQAVAILEECTHIYADPNNIENQDYFTDMGITVRDERQMKKWLLYE